MNITKRKNEFQKNQAFNEILASDLSDIDKLARAFAWLIDQSIRLGEAEIELYKALSDQESLVKEQIKVSTLKHSQALFAHCYQRVTGRSKWNG
jgi:hypothetical protein